MAFFDKKAAKKEKKTDAPKRHARAKTPVHGSAHDTIRAPWFSEKALIATEKGIYTFAVPMRATKAEVAGAIKDVFGVSPRQIRIVNLPGKKKNLRTKRGVGTRAARRKAYVYLNQGDTIQFA
ncbi:50S ribosomal protein L23 [Patescibacteria group bacterium]|nr:50S ribosomal protein L23 [Patescibacteria group bacterium]